MEYGFETKPFEHQLGQFNRSREMASFAIFWEQGTGKTKLVIDTAAWLFERGKIDAVLVIAPVGVDENWISDEIPTHCPRRVWNRSRLHLYQTSKRATQWHQRALRQLMYHEGLAWCAVPYETYITKAGKKFVWEFLKKRRCLYIADEATDIKSVNAKRTISIVASGKYAPFRRVMNGTPISNAPFDVYSQVKFVDEDFWRRAGFGTYAEFKVHFGIWSTGHRREGDQIKEYPRLDGYKNLDQLHQLLDPISSRVLKKDVLDLPPKLYSKRYFELNSVQRQVYADLKEEMLAWLPSGRVVSTQLAITKLLRLHQVTCGYVPTDDGEGDPMELLGDSNPRLDLLRNMCEYIPHKAIIWARFRRDIELIMTMIRDMKQSAVAYYGAVGDEERAAARKAFQDGDVKWFVGNPAVGGRGLTLHAAQTVVYYNNSFNLTQRLQSEDRAHRAGLTHPVNYIDLMARGTVDVHIVANLRKKLQLAETVLGDDVREWI